MFPMCPMFPMLTVSGSYTDYLALYSPSVGEGKEEGILMLWAECRIHLYARYTKNSLRERKEENKRKVRSAIMIRDGTNY